MMHSTPQEPSHSRYACLHDCEREFEYKYVEQLEANEPTPFLHMGKVGHAGLAALYTHGLTALDEADAAMATAWGTARFFGDYDWCTLGHISVVVHNYASFWHKAGDDWEVVKVGEVDKQLRTTIAAMPFLMSPDLVVRQESGLYVVDHKFISSYLGSKLYNRTKFGHQLRLYAAGLQSLLQERIMGGITNAAFMGQKAVDEGSKAKRFERYAFDYTEADLEESIAWLHAGRLKEARLAEAGIYAQNPGDHCGWCDFRRLCERPARMRQGLVKLHYRRREA